MQGSGMITPTLQVKAGSPLHTKKAKSAGRYLQLGGSAPPALGGSRERSLDLFPALGAFAPNFAATKADLSDVHLEDWRGQRVVLNIFPSVDTGVCAASVRRFNAEAAALKNTIALCISKDLPFALNRFWDAEGLDKVVPYSTFRFNSFAKGYGLLQMDGPLRGLLARAVVVIDTDGKILYTELVPEITEEPNYEAALAVLKK